MQKGNSFINIFFILLFSFFYFLSFIYFFLLLFFFLILFTAFDFKYIVQTNISVDALHLLLNLEEGDRQKWLDIALNRPLTQADMANLKKSHSILFYYILFNFIVNVF